jgi:hypothetical protein
MTERKENTPEGKQGRKKFAYQLGKKFGRTWLQLQI